MKYNPKDIVDTLTYGFVTVMATIPIKENKNPKYDKLGGRTLYWVQDLDGVDIFLWDTELSKELSDEQIIVDSEDAEENLWALETGMDDAILPTKGRRK